VLAVAVVHDGYERLHSVDVGSELQGNIRLRHTVSLEYYENQTGC